MPTLADAQKKLSKLTKWEGAEVRALWVPLLEAAKRIYLADYATPIFREPFTATERGKMNQAFSELLQVMQFANDPDTVLVEIPTSTADVGGGKFYLQSLSEATGIPIADLEAVVAANWKLYAKGKVPASPSAWMMAQFAKPSSKAKTPAKPAGKATPADIEQTEEESSGSPVPWILGLTAAGLLGLWWYSRKQS